MLSKKVDANIFYTQKSRIEFVKLGLNQKKTFVANNTFDVGKRIKSYENNIKNKILFVGSLDIRKQNDILVNAFANIQTKIADDIELIIIGEGNERERLLNIVENKNIKNKVRFVGKVIDTEILKDFYKEAIVSVSFGQAGLSVLQSLGYGVPFMTKENAISGGEKTNIINRENGIFCQDSQESLEYCLTEICNNIDFAKKLGEKAYFHYSEYCTIQNMNQGFLDAIENTNVAKVNNNH